MTPPRPTTPVFAALGALALVAGAEAVHALATAPREAARWAEETRLVTALGLSDLALFTEARYTRHPSLADLASAFQDGPASLDHFPTASLIAPPPPADQTAIGVSPQEVAR